PVAHRKGGGNGTAPFMSFVFRTKAGRTFRLVELSRNVVERGADALANLGHRGDAGDGEQSGEQAIFDSSRGLGVANELLEELHVWLPDKYLTLLTVWSWSTSAFYGELVLKPLMGPPACRGLESH